MTQWMIHLDDGKTLTDADCYPHEVQVLENLGYTPDNITSVERVIKGRHLTIKKNPYVSMFFLGTEVAADMRMTAGPQPPAETTKRILGCHLEGSDPPVQCRLVMDPRNHDVTLSFTEVKKSTRVGINAKPLNPIPKGEVEAAWRKDVIGNIYTVVQSNVIESVHTTPNGLAVILRNPRVRAELVIRSQNVLLGFTQKGQKLLVR